MSVPSGWAENEPNAPILADFELLPQGQPGRPRMPPDAFADVPLTLCAGHGADRHVASHDTERIDVPSQNSERTWEQLARGQSNTKRLS